MLVGLCNLVIRRAGSTIVGMFREEADKRGCNI